LQIISFRGEGAGCANSSLHQYKLAFVGAANMVKVDHQRECPCTVQGYYLHHRKGKASTKLKQFTFTEGWGCQGVSRPSMFGVLASWKDLIDYNFRFIIKA